HDRAVCQRIERRGPDIEHEAVLAHAPRLQVVERHVRVGTLAGRGELRRPRTMAGGIAHAGPWRGRLRRQEAVGAARVVAVGYALEGEGAVDGKAAQAAAGRLDDGEQAG